MRTLASLLSAVLFASMAHAGGTLFVGLETAGLPTRSTDLAGFPDVTYQNRFTFEVSGAAATPEGLLYLCNGAFTTQLYSASLESTSPQHLATIGVDISALAYGRGTLWGYSNYATPKGIYEIDPPTGQATLVLDVYTGTSYRFFALDYNPADGLLYGYTEYGDSGLYSIDLETGVMLKMVDTIPASNGQGRGLAVGNNTVYLTATRGDDQIPHFAYDISQGAGGLWVPFTNPYPDHHSTGGSAFIPDPMSSIDPMGSRSLRSQLQLEMIAPNPTHTDAAIRYFLPTAAPVRLEIFDISGRAITTLAFNNLRAGSHSAVWNGRDAAGRLAPAGSYVVQLEGDGEVRSGIIRLVR